VGIVGYQTRLSFTKNFPVTIILLKDKSRLDRIPAGVQISGIEEPRTAMDSMSNLWIYWRRASSVIRYRHGGESAIYPMLKQTIVGSQGSAQAAIAAQSTVIEAPAVSEDNILDFASAKRPAERTRPARAPRNVKPKRRE